MKKTFSIITAISIIICLSVYYLFKTYNPTAPGWKTDLVVQLAKLTDIFYLTSGFKKHNLPVYKLFISPKDKIFLDTNLPNIKQTRILSDAFKQFVPAKLSFQGQQLKVKVRYRGYDFDHWARAKKSLRIKFDSNNELIHQTAINLIIPEDRGMYLEELSQYRSKKLGLVVPASQFIWLTVNDQSQGVYWQVEHWTEEFLRNQNLPIGDLYGENDEALTETQGKPLYQSIEYWQKYISHPSQNSDPELSKLLNLLNQANDQDFFNQLPEILDIDTFLAWNVESILMGSGHQDAVHNIRLYYHPDLHKFLVIPWDVAGGFGWPVDYNPLVTRVLSNPVWFQQRNDILKNYVDNPDNLQDDLKFYDNLITIVQTAVLQDQLKFFSNYGYVQQVKKSRQTIIDQFQLIKESLANNNIPDDSNQL
jgi:spore coat protein H